MANEIVKKDKLLGKVSKITEDCRTLTAMQFSNLTNF